MQPLPLIHVRCWLDAPGCLTHFDMSIVSISIYVCGCVNLIVGRKVAKDKEQKEQTATATTTQGIPSGRDECMLRQPDTDPVRT